MSVAKLPFNPVKTVMDIYRSHKPLTKIATLVVFLACSLPGWAASIETRDVFYDINGVTHKGFYAYDADNDNPQPGILVVHEWWGQNAYARSRAEELAKAGYSAFALDMYGEGKVAEHPSDAKTFMTQTFEKTTLIKDRFEAALNWLKAQPEVDATRTGAVGYCYGGGIVLNMARIGQDLDVVASFHGSLSTGQTATPPLATRIAVFVGDQDMAVSKDQRDAFEAEMNNLGADYSLNVYPGVLHSFTNPGATAVGAKFGMPLAYDETADRDSWEKTLRLFAETFNSE
ncbi:MAG: dienelactone hydrolase family protein [bacterium]